MQKFRRTLWAWVALVGLIGAIINPAAVAAATNPKAFADGFEGRSFNPFWTVGQQFGNVGLSTSVAHTGRQSAQFSSATGGQRDMHLKHIFPAATKGNVSVYLYDAAPGQETLYEKLNLYNSAQPQFIASLGVQDFDANCYSAVFVDPAGVASGQNANCGIYPQLSTTSVHRTPGWHLLNVNLTTTSISLSIDGQHLFSAPGDYRFDTIDLSVTGPYWRPNTVAYFDDFKFSPPPAPKSFADSFEGASFNPFWPVGQQFGNVGLSTSVAHTGRQSAQFSSATGGQRDMHLKHIFPAATKGNVSVYLYDAAPGQETLYEKLNLYNSAQPQFIASLGVQDFDANCYSAVFVDPAGVASGQNANCGIYPQLSTTSVHRTPGWHLLNVNLTTTSISLSIDGQHLFSAPGDYRFDTIDLSVTGPYWRPNTVAYFDDFRFTP